jgi:hypothetical protein
VLTQRSPKLGSEAQLQSQLISAEHPETLTNLVPVIRRQGEETWTSFLLLTFFFTSLLTEDHTLQLSLPREAKPWESTTVDVNQTFDISATASQTACYAPAKAMQPAHGSQGERLRCKAMEWRLLGPGRSRSGVFGVGEEQQLTVCIVINRCTVQYYRMDIICKF